MARASSTPILSGTRPLSGEPLAVERGRNRIVMAAAGFLGLFALMGLRIMGLALSGPEDHSFLSASREADRPRADIVDRRGQLLATDLSVWAAYADPAKIWDPDETAELLGTVLPDLDVEATRARLARGGRFVWIGRELTPQEKYDIHNLGLPGIDFVPERKRFYPHRDTLAHVLGYADIDGQGISGVELAFERAIAGRTHADEPVALSIDLRVQHSLHNELAEAMGRFRAKGAAGVIMNVHTGEVLAMVSLPSFDPNLVALASDNAKFNRATAGVYELGSTMKAFTVATALDTRTVSLEDGYDASEPIRYGRFRIRDFHPENRYLTVPEIFYHSSNIGTARMALDITTPVQQEYLNRFGMLTRPTLELPEVAAPLLPPRWGDIETMTISYGHGIAVSPLQMAVGAAALVNGGCLPEPTILPRARPAPCNRVISEETSQTMLRLLRQVVEEGTGKKADVTGFPVAGKTGTAEKARAGGYARRSLITSFMGAFPANAPDYVVYVVLDEPRGTRETFNFATAGWNAAPVAGQVVARVAPLIGVRPVYAVTKEDEETLRRYAETAMRPRPAFLSPDAIAAPVLVEPGPVEPVVTAPLLSEVEAERPDHDRVALRAEEEASGNGEVSTVRFTR